MAAIQLQIFENKLFEEKLEQLVKNLMKKIISQESSSVTEVEGKLFSTILKKEMSDVESVTSDSSYFLDGIASDVSYNTLRDDPATTTITGQEQDSIIDKVEMSTTTLFSDSGLFPDDPETSVSTEKGAQDPGITKETDPFISTLIKTIKRVAPNLCYKPKHLRRKKFKVVPFEFASVWRNLPSIFSEDQSSNITNTEDFLPGIAFEKVNSGAIKRFPTPSKFPVMSASQDESFYEKPCDHSQFRINYNTYNLEPHPCDCLANFEKPNPFGSLPGYETNLGVVRVPSTPLYGYVWDTASSNWLLHAEVPQQGDDSRHQDQRTPSRRSRTSSGRGRTGGRSRRMTRRRRG